MCFYPLSIFLHKIRCFCHAHTLLAQPDTVATTKRKRKEALEIVLNEQHRQRQSPGDKRNVEGLQLVSLKASEWFRTRALEIAKKDAIEARDLYLDHPEVMNMMAFLKDSGENTTGTTESANQQQGNVELNASMIYESLHESFGLMDIDDFRAGDEGGHDSTLNFWANSSWTKDMMDE